MSEHIYTISSDFPNAAVNVDSLTSEIEASTIAKVIDYILVTEGACKIYFKTSLSGPEITTLSSVVAAHLAIPPDTSTAPTMADGRPIVRADTRPLDTQTYFTSSGDDVVNGIIGDGSALRWDFSNDDDLITISASGTCDYCDHDMAGMKAKKIDIQFIDPVWPKDGAVYFFDAPWGCYVEMQVVCPAGGYYKDPNGVIPATALGLSGTDTYTQAAQDTKVSEYIHRHYITGDCPMGDELNAEGCTVDAIPAGYIIRGLIVTPSYDTNSKGYASFEMYRARTVLLPGESA